MDNDQTTKSIWNKTSAELTVGDQVKTNFLIPAIAVGGVVAAFTVIGASNKAVAKFQAFRANRKLNKTENQTEE